MVPPMPEDAPLRRSRSAERLLALTLAVAGAVVARLCFQERMLVDGAGLSTFFARGDRLAYHFLYIPVCRLLAPLAELLAPGDPIESPRLCSAIAFGVGIAFTWLFACDVVWRRWGAPGAQAWDRSTGTSPGHDALIATLLVACAPATAFLATTIEVHTLHLATVAVASWILLRLPWRRPVLATAVAAVLFALIFWAHQMGVLIGPGWVLLCGLCSRWAGRPLSTRALVLGVGPALLLADILASAVANYLQNGVFLPNADEEIELIVAFHRLDDAPRFWWDGWLMPLAFLLPAAFLGLARGAFVPGMRVVLAVLCGVPLAFLFTWGVSEYGGYTLGHAPFLAVLAAGGVGYLGTRLRAPVRWALVAVVLAAQLGASAYIVVTRGRGYDVEERARLVAEHLQGGTFLKTAPNAPSIKLYLPDAFEIVADDVLIRALIDEREPDETVAILMGSARTELARTGRLLLDLGYETQTERATIRQRLPVLDALRAAMEREFTTTRVEHRDWPLLIVEP
jgi:hypothetical protein